MRTRPVSTPSTQALPDTLTPVLPNVQPKHACTPTHGLGFLFSPPTPDTANRSTPVESATDHGHDATSAAPHSREDEDEYTLCAYGDISLSEIIVPPLPAPTHPSALQPRYSQPRLRLKVRRPPMPKRRPSYTCVPDPSPYTGGLDSDERWPGSPRPFTHNPPWAPRQLPLLSPLPTTSRTQGIKPVKTDGSSLERLFDELIPPSPSVRLSPPGSPANRALGLPQETGSVRHGPPSSLTPAPRQDRPQEVPWRQRLPPRLPIPKWDM